MKNSSEPTFRSRLNKVFDNPFVGVLITVASHPVAGLAFRGLAIGMAVSNPISLGVVLGAQAICIGIDTAREYRSSRLKERKELIDHYGRMVERLDAALLKLEPDAKKRQSIKDRFNKAQEKPEYEKQPRRGLEKGELQYRVARFIEWGAAMIMDSISSHGIALAKYLPVDVVPELFTMGRTSEAVGTYAKRKKVLEENKKLREELIVKAQNLNIPGYNRSTVQLGKHVEDLERNVRALEKLAAAGETYSNAKFAMCRADEESKPLTFEVESRVMCLLKSLRGAVFGSKEDYEYVFDALDKVKSWVFGVKPEPATHQAIAVSKGSSVTAGLATEQSRQIHFDPKAIFDAHGSDAVVAPSNPSRPRSNSLDEGKIKRMVDRAEVSSGVTEESETPTTTRPRSKSI